MVFKEKRNLALVLSGGSARGIAHIGVLEVLEEHHVPIDLIVGTSMGALVGGLYAAGKLKQFKEELLSISKNHFLSLFLSRRIRKGNTTTEAIEPFLRKMIDNKKIEHLDIGFTAVAADLKTGKEVFIEDGSLLKALLASISLPGIFQPVKYGKRLLVDGGIVDPLPQHYGMLAADKVIAINAMPAEFKYKKESDVFDVISESVGIMTNELIHLRLKKDERCVFIQLNTSRFEPFDFSQVQQLIALGRKAAEKELPKILALVNPPDYK